MTEHRLIGFEDGERQLALATIAFRSDGSLSVAPPVDSSGHVLLEKRAINLSQRREEEPVKIELRDLRADAEGCVHMVHHFDGMLEFCGPGLSCGRDENGVPRGMAIAYHSFTGSIRGPAFTLAIRGIEHFQAFAGTLQDALVISSSDIAPLPFANALVVEVHYFPAHWRRFICVTQGGVPIIRLLHPGGGIVNLRVLLPQKSLSHPLFAGVTVFRALAAKAFRGPPGFCLESMVGRKRLTVRGDEIRESLRCFWPEKIPRPGAGEYFLNEVDYDAGLLNAPVIPAEASQFARLDSDERLWPVGF